MRRLIVAGASAVLAVALAIVGANIAAHSGNTNRGTASAVFLPASGTIATAQVTSAALENNSDCQTDGATICVGPYGAPVFSSPNDVGRTSSSPVFIERGNHAHIACELPVDSTAHNTVELLYIAYGLYAGKWITISSLEDPAIGPLVRACVL